MGCTFTSRDRELVPFPQVFVHADQRPQSDQRQSTGQPSVLHAIVASPCPWQFLPPLAAGVETLRLRTIEPPPHVLLQFVHGLQLFHSQSTGQPSTLQSCSSLSVPVQSVPPFAASKAFCRLRMVLPPAQLLVQSDQLPQGVHSQFTGQPATLQLIDSLSEPSHCLPPFNDWTKMVRFLSVWPPPHVAEHPGHSDQSLHKQSMTHGSSWHVPFSVASPSQSLPPCFASTAFPRLRVFVPFPQETLQEDQGFHSPHLQLTGHASVLHLMVSFASPGQALPPPTALTFSLRVLSEAPVPQVFEQEPHFPHSAQAQSTGQTPLSQDWDSLAAPMQHLPPC
mmetsp:Transcript_77670/g.173817  ORF Transcript_77670/g.173817 Transcript_77670/m.173817 type:complete len:337 (+) Transcript_77670:234-1244(+)